jgi:hypothetical protein
VKDVSENPLEILKLLFVPKTMQEFMDNREKMNREDMMKLEKQRKEKQKRELEKALGLIIVNFESYKKFVNDKDSKK